MTQRSTYLLLCAALASCASDVEDQWSCSCGLNLIVPSPMYSAHDGVHEYSVTPWIPAASSDTLDSDPLMASTIRWEFDKTFVEASEFTELAGGVKLTTKKAGTTRVKVSGSTVSGVPLHQEAELRIAAGKVSDWELGDVRYQSGEQVVWTTHPAELGEGTCGLSENIDIPSTSACTSCHDSRDNMLAQVTPTQTAGYSDHELINIFLTGAKPAGGTFNSPFLRDMPMPDCVFAAFHTWTLTEPEQVGMVLKLRSLPPRGFQ